MTAAEYIEVADDKCGKLRMSPVKLTRTTEGKWVVGKHYDQEKINAIVASLKPGVLLSWPRQLIDSKKHLIASYTLPLPSVLPGTYTLCVEFQ